MPGSFWTPEEEERLKVLHAKGIMFIEIATILGKTRSMIAGKCYRMKLTSSSKLINPRTPRNMQLPPLRWKP